ncbi:hypothetical protein AMAG_19861 [Allomyces macrogynus ATCC 38327]|uniref:Uncharacterized protein n=1 Tax=Allomyces macrogynus (strain ATCC 38327) TaxID=578462 RepID=A0A0L0T264_ALLM3|nr:hypothetical protein AMAG_19861 [Allomyces macrogynus ATCC 38327]|eukprot:KNE68735.1 hypothetical protein AMAG_19861 [Allomyces macrogynus ATCC 38327]
MSWYPLLFPIRFIFEKRRVQERLEVTFGTLMKRVTCAPPGPGRNDAARLILSRIQATLHDWCCAITTGRVGTLLETLADNLGDPTSALRAGAIASTLPLVNLLVVDTLFQKVEALVAKLNSNVWLYDESTTGMLPELLVELLRQVGQYSLVDSLEVWLSVKTGRPAAASYWRPQVGPSSDIAGSRPGGRLRKG